MNGVGTESRCQLGLEMLLLLRGLALRLEVLLLLGRRAWLVEAAVTVSNKGSGVAHAPVAWQSRDGGDLGCGRLGCGPLLPWR